MSASDVAGSACGDRKGTRAGYRAHQRAGDIACEPCLAAERVYQRGRKRRTS